MLFSLPDDKASQKSSALLFFVNMKFEMLNEYLWWFERIICRKVNGKKEDATLVWTVGLQQNNMHPSKHITYNFINR